MWSFLFGLCCFGSLNFFLTRFYSQLLLINELTSTTIFHKNRQQLRSVNLKYENIPSLAFFHRRRVESYKQVNC